MTTHVRLPDTAASARDRGRYLVAPTAAVRAATGGAVAPAADNRAVLGPVWVPIASSPLRRTSTLDGAR